MRRRSRDPNPGETLRGSSSSEGRSPPGRDGDHHRGPGSRSVSGRRCSPDRTPGI